MGLFITTTDSLTPHVTDKGNHVCEQELSHHITGIRKAEQKLNEVYITQINMFL